MADIAADLSSLVRKEIELARSEITELVRSKLLAVGSVAAAAVLGVLIAPFLLLTLTELLAIWLPRWAAAGIVTVIMMAGAVGAILFARSKFRSKFKPERTIRSVKEDIEWVKHLKN